jgi:hypothetical protein
VRKHCSFWFVVLAPCAWKYDLKPCQPHNATLVCDVACNLTGQCYAGAILAAAPHAHPCGNLLPRGAGLRLEVLLSRRADMETPRPTAAAAAVMAVLVATSCPGALAFTASAPISGVRSSAGLRLTARTAVLHSRAPRRHRERVSARAAAGVTGDEEEDYAAKRACSRLSDSHVAAFQKDGFVMLRQGVSHEFEAYLAAVEQNQGEEDALQELARRTPPRALVTSLASGMRR